MPFLLDPPIRRIAAACMLVTLLTACETVDFARVKDAKNIVAPTGSAKINAAPTFEFPKLVFDLAEGATIQEIGAGAACMKHQTYKAVKGGWTEKEGSGYQTVRDTLADGGLKIVNDPTKLFQINTEANYAIAAKISELNIATCTGLGTTLKVRSFAKLDWEIFSKTEKAVVFTISTEGSHNYDGSIAAMTSGKSRSLALQHAAKNLLADPKFIDFMALLK